MVPADPVLSRELNDLRDEVAAVRREGQRPPAPTPDAPTTAQKTLSAAPEAEDTSEIRDLHDRLGELVDHVTQFFADAEKNITAHPTESVVAALLLGILIGRASRRG